MSKLGIKINQDFAFLKFMMRGKKSDVIFFPGCAFMKLGYDLSYKVLSLIRRTYKNAEICSICCSNPSIVLSKEYHDKQKKKIVNFLIDRNAKIIYTACPNCFKMLKYIFNEFNLNIEVLMVYDYINKEIDSIGVYHKIQDRVVVHDPCIMRNQPNTQNAVRNILDTVGQEYIDVSNSRNKTVCCGNINMLHFTNKRASFLIRNKRVDELKKTANIICSYCNGCLNSFLKENIKVIHLLELVFGKSKSNNYFNRLCMTFKLEKI